MPSAKDKKSNHHKNKNHKPPPYSPSKIPLLHKALSSLHKLPGSKDTSDEAILIAAVAGAALLLFLIFICTCCCCCCCCKRKKAKHTNKNNGKYDPQQQRRSSDIHLKMPPPPPSGPPSSEQGWAAPPMMSSSSTSSSGPYQPPLPPPHPVYAIGFNKSSFTYDELATATHRFDRSLVLGQGGFGYVYKGVLPNGKEVAVKSLKAGGGQGEREFQAEVDIISRVHHRHLVSLVGYCIAGPERMLVYEFIPNRTIEYHLRGKGRSIIDCTTRLKIALGAAKGLAYLHEDCNPRIIHRDIKAANILIDNQYEAKVADFGLAKLSSDDNTHVSTRVMGTFGYLAPEYASTGKLTEKSDVFSFGVVLLELITGKKPVEPDSDDDNDCLLDWAAPILIEASNGGSFEEMVDPRLEGKYNRDEMHRMVTCATVCLKHSAKKRPKMSQVVRALEGNVSLDDLNEASKKAQAMNGSSGGSSSYDSDMHSYNGNSGCVSSQEFSSSEHGTSCGESRDRNRNP